MVEENLVTENTDKAHYGYKEWKGAVRYRLTNDYMFRAVMQKNKNVLNIWSVRLQV